MVGSVQHYLTMPSNGTMSNDKTSESVLPASWYSSQEMYDFERRAIFSKRWLFISHKSRLAQTGDWLRYSFAGYDIIITRDRTGALNTFHNVCRHRAYPVIEKEGAGNNKILACRYHGWSYGLNGKLAKAPGYQEMDFEKDQNSLFRCHTKIDSNGFIWVNLSGKEESPEVSWEEHFSSLETQNQHSHINFDDYVFDTELKKEDCKFNWKNAFPDSTPEHVRTDFDTTNTFYFPNASSAISSKFVVIQKVLSQAPNKTTNHFEIYRHKDCSDADFKAISDAYTSALRAEKETYAPAFFQNIVRDVITEHYKQEKAAGKEIWPSRPTNMATSDQAEEDEELCAGLACGTQKEILAW